MISFWMSFTLMVLSWCFALMITGINVMHILLSAVFFTLYFLLPIMNHRIAQLTLVVLPLIAAWIFYSAEWNAFVWLIYLALAVQGTDLFKGIRLHSYLVLLYVLAVIPYIVYQEWLYGLFVTLLALATGTLFCGWQRAIQNKKELQKNHDAIYNEYRVMKRNYANSEELARQEERNQIAREIHDSVGHRLTALMMQLEVAKLQAADEETKSKFNELKKLAQTSLHDTREAVKTLKSEETAGLQAVIQLVRKLESESHIRVSITMQSGVLGIVLSNRQSVAIYRSIQEALTNMMRHSSSREATIEFKIVAEHDFRFQVSHVLNKRVSIKEGFGLTSMRERLSQIDGRLNISQFDEKLYLIGQFPLEVKDND